MIRKFQDSDAEVIKELTVEAFEGVAVDHSIEKLFGLMGGTDWRWRKKRHIDADIAANPEGIFIAEKEGKVIGYITTRLDERTKIGWIPNMAVSPDYQGRGMGKALLDVALKYLRDSGMRYAKIETLEQNEIGKRFYPKVGFREVARQIQYFMPL